MKLSFCYKFEKFHDQIDFMMIGLVHNDLSSSIFKYYMDQQ